ncbi:hypothetical protein [Acidithiobacillus sp.]
MNWVIDASVALQWFLRFRAEIFNAQAQLSHTTLKNGTIFHGALLVAHWSAKPFVATVRHPTQVRCNLPVHLDSIIAQIPPAGIDHERQMSYIPA